MTAPTRAGAMALIPAALSRGCTTIEAPVSPTDTSEPLRHAPAYIGREA